MQAYNPSQPASTVETPAQPTQNPINNQKRNIPIIIAGVVLLLVIAGGAYYLGIQNGRTNIQIQNIDAQPTMNPQTNILTSPTSTPLVTQVPSSKETASWKTFSNGKFNFSIKYPPSWTEKGPVADNDSALVYLYASESFGEGPEPIQYYVWLSSNNKLPNAKLTKESVGAYMVYKTEEFPSRSGALTAFITKDEKTYVAISLTPYDVKQPYPSQNKYIDIFNQMLSSFTYTN